jgi:hypothetical protein
VNARELTIRLGGKWRGNEGLACCPAHDDQHPSLAIKDGRKGIIVKCWRGCPWDRISAALKARGINIHDDRREPARPRAEPRHDPEPDPRGRR